MSNSIVAKSVFVLLLSASSALACDINQGPCPDPSRASTGAAKTLLPNHSADIPIVDQDDGLAKQAYESCWQAAETVVKTCDGEVKTSNAIVAHRIGEANKQLARKEVGGLVNTFQTGSDLFSNAIPPIGIARAKCTGAQSAPAEKKTTGSDKANAASLCSRSCNVEATIAQNTEAGTAMSTTISECEAKMNEYLSKLDGQLQSAITMKNNFQKGLKTVGIVAGGIAAAGVAYNMYDDHKDDKKKEKREKQAAEDYKNGVITDGEGNKVQCFSEAGYQKLDCRETMTRLCQDDDKASKGGCTAFNNSYCSGDGQGTNYCMARDAAAYCKTAGMNTNSPACKWNGSRPSLCKSEPENMECLYSGTVDALNLACANFPNDPLCKAHNSGRIVTIGGSSSTTAENDGSSTSMDDVAGDDSGSTDQASTSPEDDLLPQTASLWTVSTSQVNNNCAAGTLTGCN